MKGENYFNTLKLRVVELHRDEPTLDTTEVARRTGVRGAYVRLISNQFGLAIPRAKAGRPKGTTGRRWYAHRRAICPSL